MKKKILILLIGCLIYNCSSDGDESSFDLNLLYGQWFEVGLCPSQNNLLLNTDGAFISFSSRAVDCNDPLPDTLRFTGTYQINGDFFIANTLSTEVVIDGTNDSVADFEQIDAITEIIVLTSTTFQLSTYIVRENGVRDIISNQQYER